MTNPYRLEGPAVVSFSGGRTSGYMLWHHLDAHDGKLPDDVHVCFANTGKEREETLRFVHDCATHWGVRIRWLEWQTRPRGPEGRAVPHSERFAEVGYNSASRAGEPFKALIERWGFLPNLRNRFCTSHLKIDTMRAFMLAQGYKRWNNSVGLRADEMHRVMRQLDRHETRPERWTPIMPMATAGVTKADVMDFWARQPFNLQLRGYEGNCDLCFLKGENLLRRLMRDNPEMTDWWKAREAEGHGRTKAGARFSNRWTYEGLERQVQSSPLMPLDLMAEDDEFDAECGLSCSGEVVTKAEISAQVDRMLGDVKLRRAAAKYQAEHPDLFGKPAA